MERIGIVGLGRMGSALAARLAGQGLPVTGWTRSGFDAERAAEGGFGLSASLQELAQRCDILILSLFDDQAVTETLDHLLQCPLSGKLIIDTSTVSPTLLANRLPDLSAAGADAVDAPISGGPEMVAAGVAGVFVGGEDGAAARALPVIQAFSQLHPHVGPVGSGMAMKITNNALILGCWGALSEVVQIAKRMGLSKEIAIQTLAAGPAANGMFKSRVPRILGEDSSVGFAVAGIEKDLAIFIQAAEAVGVDVPGLQATRQMVRRGVENGLSDLDAAALISDAYDRA